MKNSFEKKICFFKILSENNFRNREWLMKFKTNQTKKSIKKFSRRCGSFSSNEKTLSVPNTPAASKAKCGTKLDSSKADYWLIPIEVLKEIAEVLTFGKVKYGEDNWKKVPHLKKRYYNACQRHLTAWREGKKIDKETGRSHLSHAICSLIFILWKEKQKSDK